MFHGFLETKGVVHNSVCNTYELQVSIFRHLGVVLKFSCKYISANKSTQSVDFPTHFLRETYRVSKSRHFFVTLKYTF